MKLLVISDNENDLIYVLRHIPAEVSVMTFTEALDCSTDDYDAFCVIGISGAYTDPRLRKKLETVAENGKRIFLQYVGAFSDIYSDKPCDTTRSRLVFVGKDSDMLIPGLETGDLLDDESNLMMRPWFQTKSYRPVLVYREHIIAHTHTDLPIDKIMENSKPGMWFCGKYVLMTSFRLDNFNLGRFSPSKSWLCLISYIVKWLTGFTPTAFPTPIVRFGIAEYADLNNTAVFEAYRKKAVSKGIAWLERFLVDDGKGGIKEGLRHNIYQDGSQEITGEIRSDCCGEAAGALCFYGVSAENARAFEEGNNLEEFIYDVMLVKAGAFSGMMRWTGSAWLVCYQDDAARAILPTLYKASFLGDKTHLSDVFKALDFLVATTAKDGCRVARTDCYDETKDAVFALNREEHGHPSAHYNAYYHAALILGYLNGGKHEYLETAQKGIETMMTLYPNTKREQSETEEYCRLILGLALLYRATGEEKHKAMLYRVAKDLQKFRHPFGGYCEWDTGYQACCSRESKGECSILSENGNPITDALYSVNWLPVAFAMAYRITGDEWFNELWRDICVFFIRTQLFADDFVCDGAWTRAFDMDLKESYANPHDVGWAANACETGWTVAEILMGMMLPDIITSETSII